jgi:hypothetical protein
VGKYRILLRILDAIRAEAGQTKFTAKYARGTTDAELIGQARGRAFIHLYLKVMFGLTDFAEREQFVTDGSHDGGIDGYYIDRDSKRIYLLQSKFRNTEKNFESVSIKPDEILVMDIDQITSGATQDASGNEYNGKILGLVRKISEISDIARYNYHVAILANCDMAPEMVRRLTGGYKAEVFNFSRSYNELVFPIVSGTYFRASDLTVQLDLTNKSAGAKTNYSVSTPDYECEITVLFLPTLEIAKVMEKYRNSILEFNPRSYLDFEGQIVNAAIRRTLLKTNTNEFALMNNGLTILSDETNLNERIGLRNKAQLRLLNPQIINGGQTAYTLSRVLQEDAASAATRFEGKEVLVKVITLTPKNAQTNNANEKMRLIEEISVATNRQTAVTNADRYANESVYIKVQKALFDRYGLLYERKRGEFSDGILAGYIDKNQILERNLFIRIFFAVRGELENATRKKIFTKHGISEEDLTNSNELDKFVAGYEIFRQIAPRVTTNAKRYREALAQVYIAIALHPESSTAERIAGIENDWAALLRYVAAKPRKFVFKVLDEDTGEERDVFSPEKWIKSGFVERDVQSFVAQRLSREDEQGKLKLG